MPAWRINGAIFRKMEFRGSMKSLQRLCIVALFACGAESLSGQVVQAAAPAPDRQVCATPGDTSIKPADFGYDLRVQLTFASNAPTVWSYPTIENVRRGTPADSAGIHDGDRLIAIDGHDLVAERDSAMIRGPNVPTQLTFKRGDSTFVRTLIGLTPRECKRGR